MAPERLSFATTVELTGQDGRESPAGNGVQVDDSSPSRLLPASVHLTSGLSYACRYCGRTHYPTCR
jgi:hypothetical protein